MNISKFMVPMDKIVTLRPGDTVQRATEKMAEHNVSSVVIKQDQKVVGIVTTHDIMKIISSRKSAGLGKTMEQIMSRNILSIESDKNKNDAIKTMQEKGVHHLLVRDASKSFIGIISSFDLVKESALDIKAHPWIRK